MEDYREEFMEIPIDFCKKKHDEEVREKKKYTPLDKVFEGLKKTKKKTKKK